MSVKRYSTDWFSTNVPNLIMALQYIKDRPLKMLEIGSWEGRSTVWFAEYMPNSEIWCVDTWEGGIEHKNMEELVNAEENFKHNIAEYGERIHVYKGDSRKRLFDLRDIEFDVVYVDGSHEACDALSDMVMSFNLLKNGGIMLIDDYGGGRPGEPLSSTPKIAVDSFAYIYQERIKVIHVGYQFYLVKL